MTVESASQPQRLRLEDIVIVDADVHANETPAALAPYCDMPWRRSLELLESAPARYLDIPGFSPKLNLDPPFPGGFNIRTVTSAAQMRDELAALSIDIGILFPDNLLGMAQLPNEAYAAALARAYNRWLQEEWLAREPSLYGALVAAPQDPLDAAREIRRYASDPKVVAVYLPTSAVYPLWGNRKYDPIFEAAEETGLPVMLHSVSAVYPVFPFNIEQFDTALARHTVSHTFAMMANLISMVTTGVPVRFPSLDICFTEAGVSWVPFMMWRLDKEYNESRREVPFLEDKPSTYIKRMYFSTQPVEEPDDPHDLVATMRTFNGEDQVLFASDWPHHDFDHPRQVFDLPLSPEAKRKIMGENALRLFGIPAPARPGRPVGEPAMADYIVARVDDFPPGARRIVRAGKLEIGVFNIDGRFYAMPNVCAHQFGPLCEGRITGTLIANADTAWRPAWIQEGEILVCPWHALEYDLTTGRCIAYPRVKLRQFPVRVDGEHVVVSL